jgi:hypothetical protein
LIAEHPDSVFAVPFTNHFEHLEKTELLVRRNHYRAAGMRRENRPSCQRAHVLCVEIDPGNRFAIEYLRTGWVEVRIAQQLPLMSR